MTSAVPVQRSTNPFVLQRNWNIFVRTIHLTHKSCYRHKHAELLKRYQMYLVFQYHCFFLSAKLLHEIRVLS